MNQSSLTQILQNARWRSALFAALGGLLAEIYSEVALFPTAYNSYNLIFGLQQSDLLWLDARWGAICGLLIGLGLSLAATFPFVMETARRTLRTAAIGAGVGLVGGAVGLVVAELIFQSVSNQPYVGRGIGYAVFGTFLGAAQGFARGSKRGAINGGIGGALGGFIGGVLFDVFGQVFGGAVFSRIICITITGFFIGLFVVLFQAVLAGGVLKVLSGRLEGREFYLDKPMLTIGLAEQNDITLVGDTAVLPQHGSIQANARQPLLQVNVGAEARVNGSPVFNSVSLNPNDEIYLGNTRLIYRRALGSSGAAAPAQRPSSQMPSIQMPGIVVASPEKIKESFMAGGQRPANPPPQQPMRTPTVMINNANAPDASIKYCPTCGSALNPTARFCGTCGTRME